MSAQYILEEVAGRERLTLAQQLDAVLEYINNQQDDEAFEDFLREWVRLECP